MQGGQCEHWHWGRSPQTTPQGRLARAAPPVIKRLQQLVVRDGVGTAMRSFRSHCFWVAHAPSNLGVSWHLRTIRRSATSNSPPPAGHVSVCLCGLRDSGPATTWMSRMSVAKSACLVVEIPAVRRLCVPDALRSICRPLLSSRTFKPSSYALMPDIGDSQVQPTAPLRVWLSSCWRPADSEQRGCGITHCVPRVGRGTLRGLPLYAPIRSAHIPINLYCVGGCVGCAAHGSRPLAPRLAQAHFSSYSLCKNSLPVFFAPKHVQSVVSRRL